MTLVVNQIIFFCEFLVMYARLTSAAEAPPVPEMSHYAHDHLVRWLHDDADAGLGGTIDELGTGANVPALQKCARAIILRKEVEAFIYFTILSAAVVSGVQNYSADPRFKGELWLAVFEV